MSVLKNRPWFIENIWWNFPDSWRRNTIHLDLSSMDFFRLFPYLVVYKLQQYIYISTHLHSVGSPFRILRWEYNLCELCSRQLSGNYWVTEVLSRLWLWVERLEATSCEICRFCTTLISIDVVEVITFLLRWKVNGWMWRRMLYI